MSLNAVGTEPEHGSHKLGRLSERIFGICKLQSQRVVVLLLQGLGIVRLPLLVWILLGCPFRRLSLGLLRLLLSLLGSFPLIGRVGAVGIGVLGAVDAVGQAAVLVLMHGQVRPGGIQGDAREEWMLAQLVFPPHHANIGSD